MTFLTSMIYHFLGIITLRPSAPGTHLVGLCDSESLRFMQLELGKATSVWSCYRRTPHVRGQCFTSTFIQIARDEDISHLSCGGERGWGVLVPEKEERELWSSSASLISPSSLLSSPLFHVSHCFLTRWSADTTSRPPQPANFWAWHLVWSME
jgi:hypothetical protein